MFLFYWLVGIKCSKEWIPMLCLSVSYMSSHPGPCLWLIYLFKYLLVLRVVRVTYLFFHNLSFKCLFNKCFWGWKQNITLKPLARHGACLQSQNPWGWSWMIMSSRTAWTHSKFDEYLDYKEGPGLKKEKNNGQIRGKESFPKIKLKEIYTPT